MDKTQKTEKPGVTKKTDFNNDVKLPLKIEKNNTGQSEEPAPHHHPIPEKPKYPQRGDTDPFSRESWVY